MRVTSTQIRFGTTESLFKGEVMGYRRTLAEKKDVQERQSEVDRKLEDMGIDISRAWWEIVEEVLALAHPK
jgi:hypothetical protein